MHPNQITQWKKRLHAELPSIFSDKRDKAHRETQALEDELYRQIGQLKVELDWLKKKLTSSVEQKRHWIEPTHPRVSVVRQCELLDLVRSSYYYQAIPLSVEDEQVMRLLDEQYTRTPFYGIRRMTAWLQTHGDVVNHKRVQRLLRALGLEAISPKPTGSLSGAQSHKYPYLLQGLQPQGPNHVWCTDITYIRLQHGFVYVVAILDWFSRSVLAWELSNTLDSTFCLQALDTAFGIAHPEIFHSDQGSQFTSQAFTTRLAQAGIQISWDGRGRVFDNIFVERLWRTLTYEEVYLHDDQRVPEAISSLKRYFAFYHHERLHQALNYRTPQQVYHGSG